MITEVCGCVNEIDKASGIKRCLTKCEAHVEELKNQPQGQDYYRAIGVLDIKDQIRVEHYQAELQEALGPLPAPPEWRGHPVRLAMEIGCGVSPYVPAIQQAGYDYFGVEPDAYAVQRMTEAYAGIVMRSYKMEQMFQVNDWWGLVLAVHSLEHMKDAPAVLRCFYRMLVPGGHLVLVVPDDEDPCNPDHWWFFNETTLRDNLTRVGFTIERFAIRRKIDRENFLYCVARKPVLEG